MPSKRSDSLKTGTIVPTFRGLYLERFLHLVEGIDQLGPVRQRDSICRELAWCQGRKKGGLDSLKYLTTLLVLRDLLGKGWRVLYRQRSIFLARPDYAQGNKVRLDPATVKEQIRAAMREERLAKLTAKSTVRFVTHLEGPNARCLSIDNLIADGRELAVALRDVREEASAGELRKAIAPYLQLICGEERDAHSSLKLIDIWRYFRYHWAMPYLPTPGRNLFYLVRDAARPNHPVMGIAALGNSIVQLSDRDRMIGWSLEGIEDQLRRRAREVLRDLPKGSPSLQIRETVYLETEPEHRRRVRRYAKELARSMAAALESELGLIDNKGLITKGERSNPAADVIKRLTDVATASEDMRQDQLRESHANGRSVKRGEGKRTWEEEARSPLFCRKRAQTLADLLFAKLVFRQEGLFEAPLPALERMVKSDAGRKALRTALHANKKTKIGCNMMDIIVCGAIPPYAEVLGGKLVAMLMTSPQVVHEYRERYGNQPSEITTRLAGRTVVRPADLVFLGTTSLYHVGSSQYERIRIPGPRGREITYQLLGRTEGYGSTALSGETTEMLREVATQAQGMRRVNNVFGEGVSPRLRMTRDGLATIGIPQDLVLKHSCPRLIYGVQLATNTLEYLRGEAEEPRYVFPSGRWKEGTAEIVDFWLTRWLRPRSQREESLRKLEHFSKEELLLSREIAAAGPRPTQPLDPGGARGNHH